MAAKKPESQPRKLSGLFLCFLCFFAAIPLRALRWDKMTQIKNLIARKDGVAAFINSDAAEEAGRAEHRGRDFARVFEVGMVLGQLHAPVLGL